MADNIGFAIVVGADIAGADKNLKTLGTHIGQLDRSVKGMTIDVKFDHVNESLKKIRQESSRVESHFSKIKKLAVAGLFTGGTAAAGMLGFDALRSGLGGIGDIVADSIKGASDFEKTSTAFEVMLGSAEKATNVIGDLRKFAAESPFTFTDVADGAKQLTAYGIAANQLIPTMRALGDVTAGDRDKFQRVLQNYGQVAISGRLTGTELRDFTNNNFPLIDPLSRVKNVDKSQIRDLAEAGQISFGDTVAALKQMTSEGGKFFGMGARYADSFAGSIDRLSDSLEVLKRDFGQILIEELDLKGGARDVAAFTDRFRESLQEIRPAVKVVGDLGRAVVQVGSEFGRAGILVGKLGLTEIAREVPLVGQAVDKFGQVLDDLQRFKIDPRNIADAAKVIVDGSILVTRGIEAIFQDSEIGDRLRRNFVDPFEDVKKTVGDIRNIVNEISSNVVMFKAVRDLGVNMALKPIDDVCNLVNDPFGVRARGDVMERMIAEAQSRSRPAAPVNAPMPLVSDPGLYDWMTSEARGHDFHNKRLAQFGAFGGGTFFDPVQVRNLPTESKSFGDMTIEKLVGVNRRLDEWAAAESARMNAVAREDPLAALMGGAMADIAKNPRPRGLEVPQMEFGDRNASAFQLPPGLEIGTSQAASTIAAALSGMSSGSNPMVEQQKETNAQLADMKAKIEQLNRELAAVKPAAVVLPK